MDQTQNQYDERGVETWSIVDRFESIVALHPDSIAIAEVSRCFTFTELNASANNVAHRLILEGIEPEEPVAVSISKSFEQVAAILGILKAGGAYVPFVNNQPISRLQEMKDDVACRFVVYEDGYVNQLWTDSQTRFRVDSCKECCDTNPSKDITPNQLAYILYTSGSTGKPKGVMIEHCGVVRLVCEQNYLPFSSEFHYLYAAPLSFDVSTLEIFTPLLHGAKLVVVPEGDPDPATLEMLCHREQVQSTCMAFGFFASLFEANPSIFRNMSVVAVGGEQVNPAIIARAQQEFPSIRFINAYGPTEATMLATTFDIPEEISSTQKYLPIGKPLNRVEAFVLDDQDKEQSEGEIGELCLSGIGISRGYLNQHELTSSQFVNLKSSSGESKRIYKTGDLVHQDALGNFVFHSRLDDQIKIHGYRIELGEIESRSNEVDGVRNSAAVVIHLEGTKSIHLDIVMDSSVQSTEVLNDYLQSHLPQYMIPGSIRIVDHIPLNPNGKIDRKVIAESWIDHLKIDKDEPRSVENDSSKLAQTATEQWLIETIETLLGVQGINKQDNFLKLGGHSLRAVVLTSRVRDHLGVSLPISQIYRIGTIAGIADWIDQQSRETDLNKLGLTHSALGLERSPLSFNQQRLWMLDQLHPDDPSYLISIRLEHTGSLDQVSFENAWNHVVQRHGVLRTKIKIEDGHPYQCIDDSILPLVNWTESNHMSDSEIESQIERDSVLKFNLEESPLVRCHVFNHIDQSSVLISMHHIISDAWSCEVLHRELNEAYSAFVQGRDPILPDLDVQYTDFSNWQRSLPDTSQYKSDLEFWEEELRDVGSIELPTDFVRGPNPSSVGRKIRIQLDSGTTAQVRDATRHLNVTPYAYLLGLFQTWLYRLTNEEDVTVGTPIANREWTETEGLIGFFMETAAIRTHISCDDSLSDVIAKASRNALNAFDHRDVPFQHIVDAVHGRSENGRNPLFEVFFNHIGIDIRSGKNDDLLRFNETEIDNRTAKFDLTCYVFDSSSTLEVVFNYRESLFSQESMDRYLGQFIQLIKSSWQYLDHSISSIPILNPDEPTSSHVLRVDTSIDQQACSRCIHDVVWESVKQYPEHDAVVLQSERLSYVELWDKSTNIARALQSRNVESGDRVVLVIENNIDLAIAILATLRIGAIYVPVETSWPIRRVQQVVESSNPTQVLVDQSMRSRIDEVVDHSLIYIIDHNTNSMEKSELTPLHINPEAPAYILYTSGSTGQPKGVVQSHAAVVSHMTTFANSIELNSTNHILQLSSPAFDAAIMDMFSAWFTGASLCFFDIQHADHDELVKFVDTFKVDIFHTAPSVFRWLTRSLDDSTTLDHIRCVVLGGEQVIADDCEELQDHFPNCELFINGLGLTESSLALQLRVHPRDLRQYTRWIPIGFPVNGTNIRLVDSNGNPTELAGEIEIESDRVALGYWNCTTQSVDQIGMPVVDTNRRRFRTGDRAMVLEDGTLIHRGRIDQQVQVHGCRVELEEVQSIIRSLIGVQDASIVASRMTDGDHELHCYIVVGKDSVVSESEIRNGLSSLLPGYMIPLYWSRVSNIPRVGGGKVNRHELERMRKLPFRSDPQRIDQGESSHLDTVIDCFERILDVQGIDGNESFFQLGGNSLKAIRLFSLMREMLGTHLPISTIYRASTPSLLAHAVSTYSNTSGCDTFVSLTETSDESSVILFPGIGGQPMGFKPMVDLLIGDRSFVGLQLPALNQIHVIGEDLKQLASWVIDQMDLTNTLQAPDMIGYSFGGALSVEVGIQLQSKGFTPGHLILLDAHLPAGLPRKNKAGLAAAHLGQLLRGSDTGRLEYIRQRVSSNKKPIAPQPEAENKELTEFKKLARANRRMLSSYTPTDTYRGRVCLLRAIQPEWFKFHKDDGFNGWTAAIHPKNITLSSIHATHLGLFKDQAVIELADIVNQWIHQEYT
ncbi:MAG: amino acid adenylation domain-containing protein [Phycisphaerales bacterium]|nr:amino acid adenylation domain-containing protein [Phycisphaerales bacterium]